MTLKRINFDNLGIEPTNLREMVNNLIKIDKEMKEHKK